VKLGEECPAPVVVDGGSVSIEGGLTKREYFAGLALEGIIANANRLAWPRGARITGEVTPEFVAERAVRHADALLTELAKNPEAEP
jgi:hypothetical protein